MPHVLVTVDSLTVKHTNKGPTKVQTTDQQVLEAVRVPEWDEKQAGKTFSFLAHQPTPTEYVTPLEPVVVLDILEQHGYRVVGHGPVRDGLCVWTLHKPFTATNPAKQ
ncbi:hypothetical protein BV898_18999 [Hypsibius exemplaris]|uniref:GTP cyclohydrolase 1 feedback regulatory protein n=1 Tax=Hypsibius exemplaris TaxID=2072580 RepID=A0A9X6NHX1_HYPEX|nr:hypothetical protein BV898_18999 [Hypsibius exemplaris]